MDVTPHKPTRDGIAASQFIDGNVRPGLDWQGGAFVLRGTAQKWQAPEAAAGAGPAPSLHTAVCATLVVPAWSSCSDTPSTGVISLTGFPPSPPFAVEPEPPASPAAEGEAEPMEEDQQPPPAAEAAAAPAAQKGRGKTAQAQKRQGKQGGGAAGRAREAQQSAPAEEKAEDDGTTGAQEEEAEPPAEKSAKRPAETDLGESEQSTRGGTAGLVSRRFAVCHPADASSRVSHCARASRRRVPLRMQKLQPPGDVRIRHSPPVSVSCALCPKLVASICERFSTRGLRSDPGAGKLYVYVSPKERKEGPFCAVRPVISASTCSNR